MKKYKITLKEKNKRLEGLLQIKENALFLECPDKIITISYQNIISCKLKEDTLFIETDETTFELVGDSANIIKEQVKKYLKEHKVLEKKKPQTKEEILKSAIDVFDQFISSKKNETIFVFCDENQSALMNYAIDKNDEEGLESLLKTNVWFFFLGLYKYIRENISKDKKTEAFFRNLFPGIIDEFHEMLQTNDQEVLKDYDYEENLQKINTYFLKQEQALEINPELGKDLASFDDFKKFLKELESLYNEYVNPSEKLNIYLDIIKEKKKIDPNSKEGILKLVTKKYLRFQVQKYNHLFVFASPKYSESLKVALDANNMELADSTIELATKQFYMSLFMYCYNNIDHSEKTKEFFRNIYPNLVDTYLESDEESQKILDYDHYETIIQNVISLTMRMKKKKEDLRLNHQEVDEDSYKMYEEIEPYLLFLEESYNRYVKPETNLNILLNHQSNVTANKSDASGKAFIHFYLPIMLITGMVILFFIELFGEGGLIMELGWVSVIFFIILIIWATIGASGKECTCGYCGKWNALKLTSDHIIDSKDTWKTKVEYINNHRYEKQVAVRIDLHEKHYICENCNNETVKYVNEETTL
jgi:hypothetical protein